MASELLAIIFVVAAVVTIIILARVACSIGSCYKRVIPEQTV